MGTDYTLKDLEYWDVRIREKVEEFGLDPSGASARPERTVEDYQQ